MKVEDEIKEIIAGVIAASKDLYTIANGKGTWKGIPDYYEGYKKAVKQRARIETHAEVDKYPEELFKKRAPNQNEEENEYVKENYKNTTHPVFMDYLSVTSRGLQDNNWHIVYPDSEDYNKYVDEGIDVFKSIESYTKNIIPSLRAKDPNGVLTFELKPPKTVMVGEEQRIVDTERFEPQPKYFNCKQVVAWSWNEYGLFESHEKSVVDYSGKPIKAGRVFYFYDDTNIWKIEQIGKFVDNTFELSVIFNHDLGEFPCKKLKGVPSILGDGSIYYTSRFYYAVDLLDWSLLYSNYLNVSIANTCFPFRWMVGDECDFNDGNGLRCSDGKVLSNGEFKSCPSCDGTGMKVRTSPMKTYLLKSEKGTDKGDTSFPQPIGFISPQIEPLEFTRNIAQQYIEDSKKMLHIHTSNSDVKGSQDMTATGMSIDLKAMFAFIQPDSDQTFDAFQFLLDITGKVREGKDFEGAKLIYPQSFDFRTDADILDDITAAREASAPTFIIHSLIYQYISNRFYADKETAVVASLITSADRLLTMSNDEIIQRKAQGAIDNWELVLHDSSFKLVNDLIDENPNFLDLELQAQVDALEARAKETTPSQMLGTARERLLNIGA